MSVSPGPSPLRRRIETASIPVIDRIARFPRLVLFGIMLVLVLAGLFAPGVGWALLALIALVLLWVLYLYWPRLTGSERLMRVAVLCFLVALCVVKAFPR